MNLVQYLDEAGATRVALAENPDTLTALDSLASLYELAQEAIAKDSRLKDVIGRHLGTRQLPYGALMDEGRILPPITHTDPAHLLITGTGLTHLGSADTRDAMHAKLAKSEDNLTDSMKMFRMGLEGGKPAKGEDGVQPEWFYKGDGSCVVRPGGHLVSPSFALDGGEEPEIVGIYVIDSNGQPRRLGFCLGNEFSDHKTEKINYLYLAHSKLRPCSFGPELRLGDLPADVKGQSRILRENSTVWEKPFSSGEANMSHSLANLEAHHFKYDAFRRPGDIHVHFFGTATLSFADGIEVQPGDRFEISADGFGRPLENTLTVAAPVSGIHPVPL